LNDIEVLIDGGDRSPGVVNYLRNYIDGPLEVMVATHPHADHIGGLIAVLSSFEVEQIWHNGDNSNSKTYRDFMYLVGSEGAETHVAKLHDIIKAGNLSFYVLNPANLEGTKNNNSIVLHLAYEETDFLFTGDVEKEAEGAMMSLSSVRLPEVEIFKVGHHGSKTASSEDFLAITKPKVAIYMAGEGNSYGHPHEETIQALENIGAEIFGTDVYGTIVVTTDGKNYTLRSESKSIYTVGTSSSPQPTSTPAPVEEPPVTTIPLPTDIKEVSQSMELITRNFSWIYQGEWSWEGTVSRSLYEYYQKLPRPPTDDYSVYVTHPLDDDYIDLLVNKLKKVANEAGFTEYETVEFAAAFVQSLPYALDYVTASYDEYPRYPVETLVDKGGDCEDTSILLASIIDKLGYGVVLIMLPNHVGVGVKGGENVYGTYWEYKGNKYYYIETTGEGWGIGDLPGEYTNIEASIRPLIPIPVLTHEGNIKGKELFAEVEITVYNLGTAPAYNVSVLAGFDAGNGMLWNSKESELFTIGVNQKLTVILNLRIPLDKHTRLIIQIGIDKVLVSESYTDWFDT
jgi:beta-lactamase superfamily II metal-dependent hydrolase